MGLGVQGIFFDLDDTLIAYADAERAACLAAGALLSSALPAFSASALAERMAGAYLDLFRFGTPGYTRLATLSTMALRGEITRHVLVELGVDSVALASELLCVYERVERLQVAPLPDTIRVLSTLKPHVHLGVITNGPSHYQREKLERCALRPFFQTVVVDTEFGVPKPDRRIFAEAARQSGLPPNALVFVGNDAEADIEGACQAGWTTVHLTSTLPSSKAHHSIQRLGELLDIPEIRHSLEERLTGRISVV